VTCRAGDSGWPPQATGSPTGAEGVDARGSSGRRRPLGRATPRSAGQPSRRPRGSRTGPARTHSRRAADGPGHDGNERQGRRSFCDASKVPSGR
jgi:hypothetical protein